MSDTEGDSNHYNIGADGGDNNGDGNNWEKAWIVMSLILDATRCCFIF